MKFCDPHWEQLRAAIAARGMEALIADDGERVAANLASELADGPTIDNFDPLMGAHNAILSNALALVTGQYMQHPVLLLQDDPEHPDRGCPICCLNWLHREHDAACTNPTCNWPKAATYEWMIDRAADDMVAAWKAFQA